MVEDCSPLANHDTIEQGTIIRFTKADAEIEYGIIITADCDIFQDKYGKYLSYCPIFSLQKYIYDDLIPKLCKRKLAKMLRNIKKKVKQISAYKNISDEAVSDLIEFVNDSSALPKDLVNDINDYNKFNQIDHFNISDYKKFYGNKNESFIDVIRNFPGDRFYIHKIPHDHREGFVVNLRRIAEIEVNEISKPLLVGEMSACCAIGKLNSPYKEKMTQTLGMIFSAIGFSLDYENKRDETIKETVGEMMK